MDPQPSFCPIETCPSRGIVGAGNLRVHDSLRNRWRCSTCGKTFSGRRGTPFYGIKTEPQLVVWVVSLLAFGCPVQAVVAAFGLNERTVFAWQQRAGAHCEQVPTDLVNTPQNLGLVQAHEIRVRCQKRRVLWMAMALCVSTRLWLGGVLSPHRDKHLARALARRVKACAHFSALLVVTDGWPAYREAFTKAFRFSVRTGKRGQPRLVPWPGLVLAQTLKWQQAGRVIGIRVCRLAGNWRQIACLLPAGQVLSTAYSERLNATFRQRLAGLCRRSRCLYQHETSLQAGMYLVGTLYNFCTPHQSLARDKQERTPAMAAGLSAHIWTVGELLCYQVAPSPFVAPKRRGRKPKNAGLQTHKGGRSLVTV
jgi:transposase-like protein/IS1 family transposase